MSALLQTQGLVKNFGAVRAVDEVTLSLDAGDALGIIGPNGAGKSSLFNLIAGVMSANEGKVLWQGRDITHLTAAERCRAGIGRTYQIPKPFNGLTVYENLLVAAEFGGGSDADNKTLCRNILDQLELSHVANARAGGLRLLERKRLEMARALATRPKVLLLDEIAGGLTDLECDSLIATIKDIKAQGVSIIWIEHVVHALFAVVDRLAVINFGAKMVEGPPQETFQSADVQSIYLGIEA
ncbi:MULTISPECIES: ABC transporter ATP-binding protein [unclassified Sulfitobacter]|uniref:ABC transporter ATP-binding protein n=1 Tax=unclassified Sulfitobacter TaxID=196795 RepID=UPI0004E2A543|nr:MULTISPECIES: ABC transporter ATP-binding protein [unclassified Sulfitobacter]PTA97698.1 ABC transporter ATP-binding protein [Sulfitobacter sp. CB-A]ULO22217.1 ABC transporter ATP-binding protein [Sulfitobacter sp. CB2047]